MLLPIYTLITLYSLSYRNNYILNNSAKMYFDNSIKMFNYN